MFWGKRKKKTTSYLVDRFEGGIFDGVHVKVLELIGLTLCTEIRVCGLNSIKTSFSIYKPPTTKHHHPRLSLYPVTPSINFYL